MDSNKTENLSLHEGIEPRQPAPSQWPLHRRTGILLTVSILTAGFIFLYVNLFYLPNTPMHLFVDQVTILFDARRMFDGQLIYRDFFQFVLPATQVVYFSLFKIFGVRAWIPNVMLIVLGVSTMWLMILISRKVLPGKSAFLPAVLFLVIPFRSQLDATHHWYSTLAVMAALAVLIEDRTPRRLAIAGALFGLSTCFTQSRGLPAAVGVALFLIWEARRRGDTSRKFWKSQFNLWWPFFVVLVGFNAYFAWETGVWKFLNDTIVYCFLYYPTIAWNTYRVYMINIPNFHPWYRLPALAIFLSIHLLIPLIYILFFVRYWTTHRQSPEQPWDRLMLISLTGFFIFLGVIGAPSWLRICAVSPPGVILFVWFWNSPGRFRNLRFSVVWALAILVALGECAERRIHWHRDLNLPIGRIAMMAPSHYKEVRYFLRRTRPGEYFFGDEMYDYLLDLNDPARVPSLAATSYTRPRQVQSVIRGLETYPVKYVLWSDSLDVPPPSYGGKDNLGPLRAYLKEHYHFVTAFPNGDMVWEKDGEQPTVLSPYAPQGKK